MRVKLEPLKKKSLGSVESFLIYLLIAILVFSILGFLLNWSLSGSVGFGRFETISSGLR